MPSQQPPAFFVRGPSPFARLIFFAAASLALMATDARLHYLIEVRQGFVALLQPLQIIASGPANLYLAAQEHVISHNRLVEENRQLNQRALHEGADLQRFELLEKENDRLRKLLGAATSSSQPARLAEIVHIGRDPFNHTVIINLGARHNIVEGQAVVDDAGVIGQVTRVYPFTSEVTLIIDKELAIPVQVSRNGLRAIAFGHGRDASIDLPYLPANVDIIKGDKLVTSGIDGVYPAGLAIAEVTLIERTPDSPFAKIIGKPIAGIDNHKQLLLLGIPKIEPPSGKVINPHKAAASQSAAPAKTEHTTAKPGTAGQDHASR